MANEHNIKTFTAADIEKYHKGQLSAKEMHELEKAALDDPFLADAMEGYAIADVDVNADIEELKKRLSEKTDRTKIIPISTGGNRTSFPWLRIAAIVVVIAGAGLITYQLAFNNRSKDIAQADSKKTEEIKTVDSIHTAAPATGKESNETTTILSQPKQKSSGKGSGETVTIGSGAMKTDSSAIAYSYSTKGPDTETPAPAKNLSEKDVQKLAGKDKDEKKDLVKESKKESADEKQPIVNGYGVKDQMVRSQNENVPRSNGDIAMNRQADNQYRNNVFRGRVMDAGNNPVPFANITNTQDNVGTYSDAKGYFNLTSTDSVLNVQVRSIGFENNIAQLRNNVNNNPVVMQDDRRSLSEVVISNKKPNAEARSRTANMKLEEPEPTDGWDNYDTYLANNLKIPDEIKTKQSSGNVEVSFEVDKNGNPINVKVEKSLCDKCDKEAMRLIKEGPRWKRKVRKGRATVTIPF